jgi:hypothetical protein
LGAVANRSGTGGTEGIELSFDRNLVEPDELQFGRCVFILQAKFDGFADSGFEFVEGLCLSVASL